VDYGFDPKDPTDSSEDADGDGKSNLDEYLDGTDPNDDEKDSLTFEMALFIMIAVAIAVIVLLVIFAIVQRRSYDQQKMEQSFFREGEKEE
jgi:heme/copper-type cytochrome/quinol oxidase subunit 2